MNIDIDRFFFIRTGPNRLFNSDEITYIVKVLDDYDVSFWTDMHKWVDSVYRYDVYYDSLISDDVHDEILVAIKLKIQDIK